MDHVGEGNVHGTEQISEGEDDGTMRIAPSFIGDAEEDAMGERGGAVPDPDEMIGGSGQRDLFPDGGRRMIWKSHRDP